MSASLSRLAAAAVAGAAVLAPAVAATPAASAEPAVVRAVVAVRAGVRLPLPVPGGRVLTVLPRVGAEVVRAPMASLAVLGHDPRVAGVSPDMHGSVAGSQNAQSSGSGVLAPRYLGGRAGKPDTGQGVNVALLDTGVSDTAVLNRASGRITDGVDVSQLIHGGSADTGPGPFTDGYGHGTFMASLIAGGAMPNGGPVVGVAPAARVVVVKVADAAGNTSLSEVLAGLDWVAAHARAIQVVNLSLAVERPTAPAYGADPLTQAVEHVRAAGVAVVAAAGNEANVLGDPGLDPQALTVGAADVTSRSPQVASFSGSGTVAGVAKPDVVAPGVHVLGLLNTDSAIAKANPDAWQGDGLFRGSGTSEATAITSGVAAAYLSDHPGAAPAQVKSALRHGAAALSDPRAGSGVLRMVNGRGGSDKATSGDAGESGFDAAAWQADAWTGFDGWQRDLASRWSGPAWDAMSWSDGTWDAMSWSSSSWSAMSWSAMSWSAMSWSAMSWSAMTWSAMSWSDWGWGDK